MSPKAKSWQSVLAGVLWVVATLWLSSGVQAQNSPAPTCRTKVTAVVTFKVETADGKWMRFSVRDHHAAVLKLMTTAEQFRLTPIVDSSSGDLQIEVVRVKADDAADRVVERLIAKVGFPSFLSDPALVQVDVEAVDFRQAPEASGLPQDPGLAMKGHQSGDFGVQEECCLTCGGVQGCGCFVGASCGSCCSCCEPPKV